MNRAPITIKSHSFNNRPVMNLLFLFVISITAPIALANNSPETSAEPLSLDFITIDVAPWASTHSESGELEGAFVEIVQELQKRSGIQINMTLTPFARVDRELESGDHDCTILVPRDSAIVEHGEVLTGHDIGVVSHRDNPLSSYDDLKNQRISLLRGSSISEKFDSDSSIEKEYDTDYLIALRKLSRHRVDGVAGAIPTLLYLAKQNGLEDVLAPTLKLSEIPLVFQCSRNSPHIALMPEMDQILHQMAEDGTLRSITDRYHF